MRSQWALVMGLTLVATTAAAEHKKKKRSKEEPAAAALRGDVPLTVVCATPGAIIYLDGQQLAMTPMDLPMPVPPGDHSIKVTKLGFAPYVDVFSTNGKKEVRLEMELVPISGVVHVKSNIPGARVLVDGQYKGDAPLDLEVDVGARAVQVSKTCYGDFFNNVMSVAGQEVDVDANLLELPDKDNPCKPLPPEAPKWYKKGWVWGVVAASAAVVAGGVAAGAYVANQDPLAGADYRWNASALRLVNW